MIAKKGDLAVIAPWTPKFKAPSGYSKKRTCGADHKRGSIVHVLSDPQIPDYPADWEAGIRISHIKTMCGCQGWHPTKYLIPIRDPDAEVKRETESEVPA